MLVLWAAYQARVIRPAESELDSGAGGAHLASVELIGKRDRPAGV